MLASTQNPRTYLVGSNACHKAVQHTPTDCRTVQTLTVLSAVADPRVRKTVDSLLLSSYSLNTQEHTAIATLGDWYAA